MKDLKLSIFYYSELDIYHENCYWQLVTFLTEEEILQRMRKYAKEKKEKYNHGKFLETCVDAGILETSHSDFHGDVLEKEIHLDTITEEDIFSEEMLSVVEKKRKEAEIQKKKEERQRYRQEKEEAEKIELDRLMKKYKPNLKEN
ncbi:MAG TPA: hypothetical protein VMV95_02150 [Bacillota bacterium]|nr:hypothetical protein [Bacillota bacterium]